MHRNTRRPVLLWCDGAHDPAENMRRDTALLARCDARDPSDDPPEPVLRLFRFAPHGITLGFRQDPARVLDLDACCAAGVPWAVRPTGGRAIFHAEEWTYSLTAAIDDPDWGGSLAHAYARTSHALVASLRGLGVAANPAPGGRTGADARERQAACFASAARHEVLLDGRKLVGSAQRRTARALLQQGSVLLGEGHLRLADFLAAPPAARAAARHALQAASAHAGGTLGPDAPLARWAEALANTLDVPIRRVDGASGRFLLTLPEVRSYTPALSGPGPGDRFEGGSR